MDILDQIKLDGYESSHKNFSIMLKSYMVLRENMKISNDELDELIEYHTICENFEICDKLIKHKK